jgi:hypothetical protein
MLADLSLLLLLLSFLCPAAEKNSPQANPAIADTADVAEPAAASAPVQVAATA